MMKLGVISWLAVLGLIATAENRRPNLIFILADDVAMGDLGAYGQQLIKTPNLDRLCKEGTRYVSAYSGSSVCAPSRASFFTGRHMGNCPIRANRTIKPRVELPLPENTVTIGHLLKSAGYATAAMGKWGMGNLDSPGGPFGTGIDHYFGYESQLDAHNYFPTHLSDGDKRLDIPENENGQKKVYAQNLIQQDVLTWVDEQGDHPFFLFYAMTLPHARYEIDDQGAYAREQWTKIEKNYAAMVTRMDADIGELVDLLKKKGVAENTLVVFAGDNGSAFDPESALARRFDQSMGGKLRGFKRGLYEGALRQAAFAWWPDNVPAGRVSDEPWAFWDLLPTFAELGRAKIPEGFQPDGYSLVEFLKGGPAPQRNFFYWELHERERGIGVNSIQAVRWGNWKAVRPTRGGPIELYDLANDPGETNNLAVVHPNLIAHAADKMKTIRTADPMWPDPASTPAKTKSN